MGHPEDAWIRARDEDSQPAPSAQLRFVLEADPQLERGTIAVAGRRDDGAMHVEVIAHDPGVAWMKTRAAELLAKHGGQLWLDPKGPCGFMLGDLREAKVPVHLFTANDLPDAFSWLYTAANPTKNPADPAAPVPDPTVRHRGGQVVTLALAAAETRKVLDRVTLRRSVSADVNQGPIVGAMLAGYAVVKGEKVKPPPPPSKPVRSHDRPNARRRPADMTDLATARF